MKIFKILFGIAFLAIIGGACKKDTATATPEATVATTQKSIAKKWLVSTLKSSSAASYRWFEFHQDNTYIIAKNDTEYLKGKYTISDDLKTIVLADYGVMTITKLADSEFAFSIKLNSETESTNITTKVATAIATSSKTDLMCRNWDVTKFINDSSGVSLLDLSKRKVSVVFSGYGTYFVTNTDTAKTKYLNRVWKWKDASENVICYGDTACTCDGVHEANIKELTESSLVILEERVIATYLVPATSTTKAGVEAGSASAIVSPQHSDMFGY